MYNKSEDVASLELLVKLDNGCALDATEFIWSKDV